MNNDDKFTDVQVEKRYSFFQGENCEKLDSELSTFFSELVNWRRVDPFEGGLQAGAVIFPDKFAMKVCENDGFASHLDSFINLTKYLNNDYRYISSTGIRFHMIYANESRQIHDSGVTIRFLDGEDNLMLIITSKCEILSQFQSEVLNRLLFFCKTLKDKNVYSSVNVGFINRNDVVELDDLSNEQYRRILDSIDFQIVSTK